MWKQTQEKELTEAQKKNMTGEEIRRHAYKNTKPFIFNQEVRVISGFYKGQFAIIDDTAEEIPQNEVGPMVVTKYYVIIKTELGVVKRIVDAREIEAFSRKNLSSEPQD